MIDFRAATIDDLTLLQHWDEQPHTVASDPNDDWGWETELLRSPPWREQLIAELDGRPIGFAQIIDPLLEDSHYWGDVPANLRAIDIWIGEASDLGKSYGTEMMRQAIARCFASPEVTAIIIDPLASNVRARKFYEKLAFLLLKTALSMRTFARSTNSTAMIGRRSGIDHNLNLRMTVRQNCLLKHSRHSVL